MDGLNEAQLILQEAIRLGKADAQADSHPPETMLGKLLLEMVSHVEAPKQLRQLAELVERVPPGSARVDFDSGHWNAASFLPTLQDGLKAVMLGAFFDLMNERLLDSRMPTIGELDTAIREKWKWSGGDKELRDARRDLGLSGLPRGKSGRPKKPRGKK